MAQLVKNQPARQETPVKIPRPETSPEKGTGCLTPVFLGFSGRSDSKESVCNVGDMGSVPELGRSP